MKGYKINKRNEVIKIHIGAKELGICDDDGDEKTGTLSTYRKMLFALTRKTSTTDMDHAERLAVIAHLKSSGWKPKRPGNKTPKPPQFATEDQIGLLTHIWICMGHDGVINNSSNWALLQWANGQLKKYYNGAVHASLTSLSKYDAERLIESLKKWANRKNVEWRNPL